LNGLALKDRRPAYVTSVSQIDVNEDWREHRTTGGVVLGQSYARKGPQALFKANRYAHARQPAINCGSYA
jgi:hypothetical protein